MPKMCFHCQCGGAVELSNTPHDLGPSIGRISSIKQFRLGPNTFLLTAMRIWTNTYPWQPRKSLASSIFYFTEILYLLELIQAHRNFVDLGGIKARPFAMFLTVDIQLTCDL